MWVGGRGEGRVMGITGRRRGMVRGGGGDYVIDSQGAQKFGHCDLPNAASTMKNSGLWL